MKFNKHLAIEFYSIQDFWTKSTKLFLSWHTKKMSKKQLILATIIFSISHSGRKFQPILNNKPWLTWSRLKICSIAKYNFFFKLGSFLWNGWGIYVIVGTLVDLFHWIWAQGIFLQAFICFFLLSIDVGARYFYIVIKLFYY